jgi:3-oxoadipate enol-lactonase
MTSILHREFGQGTPLLFLHGGWGYEMYPFDVQIDALQNRFRILIPDRTGYGKSARVASFPRGFHERAAEEMRSFLDALGINRCVLWGHSDGAVTAVRMGIAQPNRFSAMILEAIHYDRCKPSSRTFFETAATAPRKFGSSIAAAMAREHGEEYWESLMKVHGQAWLDILDNCHEPEHDLYSGRIGDLQTPALLIHGSADPRTEPGELRQLHEALPSLKIHLISGAGHSPHSEPASAGETTRIAQDFLRRNVEPGVVQQWP